VVGDEEAGGMLMELEEAGDSVGEAAGVRVPRLGGSVGVPLERRGDPVDMDAGAARRRQRRGGAAAVEGVERRQGQNEAG
jgi:hypothetical protein